MAHDRALPEKEDPETVPGRSVRNAESSDSISIDDIELEEPVEPESTRDPASIDHLLALTDEGWSIDDQVLTLKQAAATRPLADVTPPPPRTRSGRPPPLPLPTPYELAPTQFAQPAVEVPSSPQLGKAPPLARSQRPPPLPGKPQPRPSTRAPSGSGAGAGSGDLSPSGSMRSSSGDRSDLSSPAMLLELLGARIAKLEVIADTVGIARVQMELAVANEILLGDDLRAQQHAEAALEAEPELPSAHALLRRRKHGKSALPEILAHIEHELAAATSDADIVELQAEKARLLEAFGDRGDAVRAMWEQALTHAPTHAAALKGLEAELSGRANNRQTPESWEALAVHFGRMADAYGSEAQLAAWLHVERASILERRLSRLDAARGALERALELDGSVGPVRDACVRHLARHADWAALTRLLAEEASIETLDARSARLELDAACIARIRLNDDAFAIQLLERAAARAPSEPSVDRRVLDELVALHEKHAQWPEAAKARRARLRFVTDPAALAHELRALAQRSESLGNLDAAIADVQRALQVDATDPTLVETLDRLLAAGKKDEQRVALWLTEAARTDDGVKRARALGRAAQIADNVLGRPVDAIRHLRSAWVAAPGDAEVLDSLSRLLAPPPSEGSDREVRGLIDLYAQAADHARDPERRIAYLEKVGLLWEEVVGEPSRAARIYEQILELDPDRRSAILGLQRSAGRVGDARALARAMLDEARLTSDGGTQLSLKTRAANALGATDPARALALVQSVLVVDPAHSAARGLETRLHEQSGRWEQAARSIRARIEISGSAAEKVGLWLALSQIHDARLHAPLDALAALQAARALDPAHPVPPLEIARLLEATGDTRALRSAIEGLAAHAQTPEERAMYLVRAAELDELILADDQGAARLYQRALVECPDDELAADRLDRVLTRKAALGELATQLQRRIERATSPVVSQAVSFDLALVLTDMGQEPARAAQLLEAVLAEQGDHVPALRLLESIHRRAGDWMPLARTLTREGDEFTDVRARLGALWSLAHLEEWRLPVGDAAPTYRKILELDPTDPGALEATVRRDLASARRGDTRARRAVVVALRALAALASDETTRLTQQLRLGLLLEGAASDSSNPSGGAAAQESLSRYREALRLDELSVTAATGLARLGNRLGDIEGAVAAATTLSELAAEPRVRARYMVDAAELLLGQDDDERLGSRDERRTRASQLLEKALTTDADSIAAAGRVATVLLDDRRGEELVVVFRSAILRAKNPDAVVMLGSEIARVARDDLKDLTVAIDAMRRVREAAPQHVPSLLTLAELCIAQRSWPEAVDALEAVVASGREVQPRLTALFALASVYEKVLSKPEEVERVLRAALTIDPVNPRALRALLRKVAGSPPAESETAKKQEIEDLLSRLSDVEKDPDAKCELLLELADVRRDLSDPRGVEAALVESVAQCPSNARAFARLAAIYKDPKGKSRDHVGYARALAAVIGRGQELGDVDARWFAALGQVEVSFLGRVRDGIAHLQRAVAIDGNLHETRFELAAAYSKLAANEEAARAVMSMIVPNPHPLLALSDPAAALELLERRMGADRRGEEAIVVSELRAIEGNLDEGRQAWLRARRVGPLDAHHGTLDRPTLVTHVLPPEGRHILLEIAAAIAGVESKMLRADLSELGISSKDKLGARSGHPLRVLVDRVVRQLALGEVEIVLTNAVSRTRVLAQDCPWIAVPRGIMELPEPTQLASIARALARIAFGVPWLEELPPPHIEGLLVAAARQVVPNYGADDLDVLSTKIVAAHEPNVARALARRQKKVLEELAPHIASPLGRPMPIDAFIGALARAELRSAYLLTGDLLATVDEVRAMDVNLHRATDARGQAALNAVLEHPFAGDVVRFALSSESTALRRRVGSTWTG